MHLAAVLPWVRCFRAVGVRLVVQSSNYRPAGDLAIVQPRSFVVYRETLLKPV